MFDAVAGRPRSPIGTLRVAAGLAAFLLSATFALCAEEAPGAHAHLFADALHAAAGTCFPKYNLELWDDDVKHELAERQPREKPPDVPRCDPALLKWEELRDYFRTAHRDAKDGPFVWRRPRLAVALEGGGSKSAPFALGALAGLHESGLLTDVDLISSVSGGSYAAYFYFSRLLDARKASDSFGARDPNAWFASCIPSIYRNRFADGAVASQKFCSGEHATVDDINVFALNFPYQAHIRYYQDVIHWNGGLTEVDEDLFDRLSTYGNVGVLFLESVATAPLHFLMNSLFAMPENSSPSRSAYRAGIERAYAHSSKSWDGATALKREPEGGAFSERAHARSYSMQDLIEVIATDPCSASGVNCHGPVWIANAAASSGRDLTTWLTVPATDALRANFEMSPYGQGSGLYGFVNYPVTMPLRDVVGSSAAFLDRDQREFGRGAMRFFAGAGIHLFNLEWGSDIPNYNSTALSRDLSRFTPFPFYHVPSARQRFSPTIHLADGGNTDNLGMLAALRRGAENIIVVASSGDGRGRMESLCRAKNHLELDGTYRISMPQLADIDQVCNRQISEREVAVWGEERVSRLVCYVRNGRDFCLERDGNQHWNPDAESTLGYDMWNWPIPVVQGTIGWDDGDGGISKVVARIYLVKPAIYQADALKQLAHFDDLSHPTRLCELPDSYRVTACSAPKDRQPGSKGVNQAVDHSIALPCSSLAFAAAAKANKCLPPPHQAHGEFPQHDVVFTTLNSSYTLFGAYYDLARHVVSQIGWESEEKRQLKVPPSFAEEEIRPTVIDKPTTNAVRRMTGAK